MLRIVSLLIFLELSGSAQQSPLLPATIDLPVAMQEAITNNLVVLAEKSNITVAEARIITARLKPNPILSLSSDHLDVLGTGYNTVNNGGPAESALQINYLLERGGKREARVALAEAVKTVTELQVRNVVRALLLDVQNSYIDILSAKANLQLANQNLKVFNDVVEINTVRVRAGDLAKVELVRSQVAALQFRNAVRQAELRIAAAKNRLQLLMGRRLPDAAFDVRGELSKAVLITSLDELRKLALELRPDLEGLRRDVARSGADYKLQLANGKVDYTVGAEVRRQQGPAGQGNSAGLLFSMPIPVNNKNQGEIERARREGLQAELRVKALEQFILAEMENAFQQHQTSKLLLESIEKDLLAQAQEVRETMLYSYRRGEASFVEFLDAQRAFNDTVQGYNDARADYARTLFLIDSITGKVVTP